MVELVVVIAIIAVLAAVVLPNVFRALEKTKITRLSEDTRVLKTGSIAYYSDVGLWPPDVCPQEDPGFMSWNAYQARCCGQNYNPPNNYIPPEPQLGTIIQAKWDGPYLEKMPPMSPWAGSYDWEYWPGGSWGLPPGTYISVRPKYISSPQGTGCFYPGPAADTDVPDNYEIKLQNMDIDKHHPGGVNFPSDHVIVQIMLF